MKRFTSHRVLHVHLVPSLDRLVDQLEVPESLVVPEPVVVLEDELAEGVGVQREGGGHGGQVREEGAEEAGTQAQMVWKENMLII